MVIKVLIFSFLYEKTKESLLWLESNHNEELLTLQ